jgi:hypothetical protein
MPIRTNVREVRADSLKLVPMGFRHCPSHDGLDIQLADRQAADRTENLSNPWPNKGVMGRLK